MKNKSFMISIKHALNGIIEAYKRERNLRIQSIIACIVLLCSLLFEISKIEFILLFIAISFVIFAEMMNTIVEKIVDLISKEYSIEAKLAKDIAARRSSFIFLFFYYNRLFCICR